MKRTLKCIGWVFAGIGIVAAGGVALFAFSYLLFLAGRATALALEYSTDTGGMFAFGYMFLFFGVIVGIALCRDQNR